MTQVRCARCGESLDDDGARPLQCTRCFSVVLVPGAAAARLGAADSPRVLISCRRRSGKVEVEIPWGKGVIVGREAHGKEALRPLGFVSREHFRVDFNGDEVFLEDVGSREGTYVQERRLRPGLDRVALVHGGEFRLGGELFTVTFTGARTTTATVDPQPSPAPSAAAPALCTRCGTSRTAGAACAVCGLP